MADYSQEAIDSVLDLLTVRHILVFPTATLTTMYLFYGVYTVLMTFCVYLLRQKSSGFENRKGYLVGLWVLFVICTIMVIDATLYRTRESALLFSVAQTGDFGPFIRYFLEGSAVKSAYYTISSYTGPGLANLVAESMLIHRCYLIWGRRKAVAVPLAIFSVMGSVIYIVATPILVLGLRDATLESNLTLIGVAAGLAFLASLISAVVNTAVTLFTGVRAESGESIVNYKRYIIIKMA
ncbi:hypothetical protein V5O48_007620 [Marasmius crinis-equi]|uniref:Uncharacterized protein n=1 Tax=Marasmius crinis-equi TaxID=585013 RepID=A0ABR3FGD4_9AGAR